MVVAASSITNKPSAGKFIFQFSKIFHIKYKTAVFRLDAAKKKRKANR